MKKVLLTLFAVAAVFVACDKEAIDIQEPIASELEDINVSSPIIVDAEAFINSLASNVTAEEISDFKNNASSARTGAAGSDWIHAIFFTFGSSNIPLVYLNSEAEAEVCAEGGQVSVLYTLETAPSGATRLKIEAIDGTGAAQAVQYSNIGSSLRTAYNTLFAGGLGYLSRANADFTGVTTGSVPQLATLAGQGIDFACGAADEWTSDASGLYTNPAYPGSSYRLTPAPFPLTGFLATIVDMASGSSSANYAGTGEDAVKDAIEGDIEN